MGQIHLVLYEPEIPQNTGNIMRTCLATKTILHLIEPLGFRLDEKEIKRSGANYIKDVTYFLYPNFDAFIQQHQNGIFYYLTRYGQKTLFDVDTKDTNQDYYFVLGKESTGIPVDILKQNLNQTIRLPMTSDVRALNVSNVAAIIVYEALRQQGFNGLSFVEPEEFKGSDYLLK